MLINMLDWKVSHRRALSVADLKDAFLTWQLRIDYFLASKIITERRGEDASLIDQRLVGFEHDIKFLFNERSRQDQPK